MKKIKKTDPRALIKETRTRKIKLNEMKEQEAEQEIKEWK